MTMEKYPAKSRNLGIISRGSGALVLAFFLSAGAYAQEQQQQQQDQQQQDQQQDQPPAQQQQQSQDSQSKPIYTPQDADRPPYSHDRAAQGAPQSSPQGAPNARYQNSQPRLPAQPTQPLPETLSIPAGTILTIRINDFLSSDKNQIGDPFTAVLDRPIVVNGWVVARRGQTIIGKVMEAKKAGHVKGTSELGVELTDLTIVDGSQLPILTELWKGSGGTSHGQDAATIGTTTGIGALIGSAADWGTGAAIGAGAGAALGIGTVLLTRGRPTILYPEEQLTFRLVEHVSVNTGQSQQAFRPVTQQDLDGGRIDRRGPRRVAGGYPYPGPVGYPCGYYAPCYPYPVFGGFYGSYGWGRGYYGRPGFYH